MKKIVCLLFCLVLALSVLTACQPEEHKHTFDTKWRTDEEFHWHQATCEHADQVADKAAHLDEDENDLCDVCGYSMEHDHTYESGWSYNKDTHYHKNTCGHADDPKYRKDVADHEDKNNDSLCDVCSYDYGHTHTYETKWTNADADGHWHLPTCGHDVPGSDKAAHVDADNNSVCDDCGWTYGHEHTYAEEWTTDENNHWRVPTCGHDVEPAEKNAHIDEDGDKICDVCQLATEHFHTFDKENWTSDADKHWHAATCEHTDVRADEAGHEGFEEDGICDVCEYVVFHRFNVTVSSDKLFTIVDKNAIPLENTVFNIKEGESADFYIAVPTYCRLEKVEGTGLTVDMINPIGPVDLGEDSVYLYKVIAAPTEDVTAKITVNKLSSVAVVEKGDVVFEDAKKFKYAYLDINFNAAEPGKYAIYCLKDTDVQFGTAGAEEYVSVYTFMVDEAGAVSLQARFFPWSAGTHAAEYTVVKVDESFVLPYMKGEGYTMPSNIYVDITFTLPEVGMYMFNTTAGNLTWYTESHPDGSVEQQVFRATEPGQVMHAQIKLDTDSAVTYDFDWNIVKIDSDVELNVGDNTVFVDLNDYTLYKFTAPEAGVYDLKHADDRIQVQVYGSYYGDEEKLHRVAELNMEKGESVILFVNLNPYSSIAASEDFEGILIIKAGDYIPGKDENGDYVVKPNMDATYSTSSGGDYKFTIPSGAQISFDYGATWQNGPSVVHEIDASVDYRVRNSNGSSGNITVKIEKVRYTFTLDADKQSNTFTMVPGKKYQVSLTSSGQAQQKDFILTWTDINVNVALSGDPLTSPATIEGINASTTLNITYNGTAEADVTFTLQDITDYSAVEKPEDNLSPLLTGTYAYAEEGGTLYQVTFANGVLTMVDSYKADYAELSGTYSYTVAGGVMTILDAEGNPFDGFRFKESEGSLILVIGISEFALTPSAI